MFQLLLWNSLKHSLNSVPCVMLYPGYSRLFKVLHSIASAMHNVFVW